MLWHGGRLEDLKFDFDCLTCAFARLHPGPGREKFKCVLCPKSKLIFKFVWETLKSFARPFNGVDCGGEDSEGGGGGGGSRTAGVK